ncbi:ABC transporter ATP-binding protein [Ruminococcus sp. FC2018]|uniref:ABC transporter ATP-binding protein n=1 Tax=Ruminococcus sp. FC2018 TaxID=1410617 RepID=UPI00048F5F81|nr:ABC transporter ATP-binding protein [Ruminococcus sp. FC2018]
MSYIEFKDVVKEYKMGETTILANDNVNFTIEKGELCVIVGASGAGKTTILNLLGGMDTCTGGNIIIDGQDIAGFSKKQLTTFRRNDVGFVFQFYNLINNLTAKENVELATQICADVMGAEEALNAVGLAERMNNFPSQLSGGEQQRVSIARAIAKKPKLLLCDEPTGALDYVTGKSILKLLQTLSRDFGVTVVIITHNSAIKPIADRTISVKSGKIKAVELNANPVDIDEIEW